MKTWLRAAATAAAVLAVGLGTTGAAAAERPGADRYGYTTVRAGFPAAATRFALVSPDVRDGGQFPADGYANAFGCTSANRQPRLAWHGAPAATRSYAVTMFDPDAPTGGGFRHWLVWNIPAGRHSLGATVPVVAVSGTNDAGLAGYLGPCPPAGDIAHRYRITVFALDVADLAVPADTPAAVAAFSMTDHVIGYAQLTATAHR